MGLGSFIGIDDPMVDPILTWGDEAKHEPAIRLKMASLEGALTACIRRGRFAHVCPGCCKNVGDAAKKIISSLRDAFFNDLSTARPSTAKWYTFEQSMVPQVGLIMISLALPRAAALALEYGDPDKQDDEFRVRVTKKANSTKSALASPDHWEDSVFALWGGEPAETLNQTLQHLECDGQAVVLSTRPNGCVFECQAELFRRATSHPDTMFPLSFLVFHFALLPDIDLVAFERKGFALSMRISAIIWSRLEIMLSEFPWVLVRLCDPLITKDETHAISHRFCPWTSLLFGYGLFISVTAIWDFGGGVDTGRRNHDRLNIQVGR